MKAQRKKQMHLLKKIILIIVGIGIVCGVGFLLFVGFIYVSLSGGISQMITDAYNRRVPSEGMIQLRQIEKTLHFGIPKERREDNKGCYRSWTGTPYCHKEIFFVYPNVQKIPLFEQELQEKGWQNATSKYASESGIIDYKKETSEQKFCINMMKGSIPGSENDIWLTISTIEDDSCRELWE